MKKTLKLSLAIVSLGLFFNVLVVVEASAQSPIMQIMKTINKHHESLFSLRSKVRMTKYNAQLDVNNLTDGTAIYARTPKNQFSLRVNWIKPINESLVMRNNQFILYNLLRRQVIAGEINQESKNKKIFTPLAFLNMSVKELKAKHNIVYAGQENVGNTPTWHLIITPKYTDVYKTADMWIDGNGMPQQIKVNEPNADTTTVRFAEIKKNPPIDYSFFQLNFPKGINVIQASAGACSCIKPFDVDDAVNNWADAVFAGKVAAVDGDRYTFEVDRKWKGTVEKNTVVRYMSMTNGCAIRPLENQKYLVFARTIQGKNEQTLGLMPCNLTAATDTGNGKKILNELSAGTPVKAVPAGKKRLPVEKTQIKKTQKRRSKK